MWITGSFSHCREGRRRFGAPRFSAIAWVVLTGLCFSCTSFAEPFLPKSLDVVLYKRDYPVLNGNGNSELVDQNNLSSAIERANRYIRYAIETTDPTYYGYAKSQLISWWNEENPHQDVRLLRALIFQHQHLFNQALHDLNYLLQLNPNHTQARLTRAAVYLAMGKVSSSKKDCEKLVLRTNALVVLNCLAQSAGLMGRAKAMDEKLQDVLARYQGNYTREYWNLMITRSDLLQVQGKLGEAIAVLERVLQVMPNHRYAQEQYAQLLYGAGEFNKLVLLDADQPLLVKMYRAMAMQESKNIKEDKYSDLIHSIRQEISLLENENMAESSKYLALLYAYFEKDWEKALRYSKKNWALQKTISDAVLLLDIAEKSGRNQSQKYVFNWISSEHIKDARLNRYLNWGEV